MKRFAFSLLVVFLCAASIPARASDVEEFLRGRLGEILPASGTAKSAAGPESREQLLKRVRDRLPGRLQDVGDAIQPVSQANEITIGRQIAGNLLGTTPLVDDARLQQYVNRVGRWVADQSERPELPWHFGVIETGAVNAFAAPGGYVFVTRGLYALLKNEGELAGVLAHEIGHVIRRHHLEILKKSRLLDMGQEMLSRKISSSAKAQAVIGRGAEIVARSLDQKAEFEADRIAVVLAARAGYEAFSLPAVLQQIGHFAKNDDSVALLFKTHPHPDVRLEKLDGSMGSRFDRLQGATLANRFHRLKPPKKIVR